MRGLPAERLDQTVAQLAEQAGPNTVGVVVVTHNRAPLLERVLLALRQQTRIPDAILVVDNASSDKTAEILAREAVSVLRIDENVGASGGFRAGCEAAHRAGFDWIWILDDDVEPASECLERLLDDPADGLAAPVRLPFRVEVGGQTRIREGRLDFSSQKIVRQTKNDPRTDIFTFEGPLVAATVFNVVGYPDDRYFISADDTDFAIRVARHFGPGAAWIAPEAVLQRLVPPAKSETLFGRWPLVEDRDFWKTAFYLRNRHLIWRSLGWRRRRARQMLIHVSYLAVDVVSAYRQGWQWRKRLRLNAKSLWQGMRGEGGLLVDPAAYRKDLDDPPANE